MMTKFWELFEQSIIVQSIITTLIVGVYVYLVATSQQVDEAYYNILVMVISFWMGSKVGSAQAQNAVTKKINALLGRREGDE